ncbi:sulfatase-like hydrolase/transferase [Paenibacillus sp. WQ 127069]|uniref:Sulfatase-like hydrolase/transferase n=1 Tax=Paenibacillus baimaensis TaxID=2982185 RepID=A0ABT2U8W6_9BACL|nr:sulfatase-like hydrolase/transferase [Paenibacillus sp. WQ 127069]MCU6791071.1 sulfatase-like hydrolase/transferase [Paenibacillus sp. WQ 127069]
MTLSSASKRPNLLLIMTDQHRADWLGCAGQAGVHTPNIDALAARGIRFTRAACNSPVCAPSRASIASGQYPHRTGVLHNKHNYPAGAPTYYQVLRKEGYRVGVVGKTDLHKADHYYGLDGDLPLLYHFGFTDPHETEGKGNASKSGEADASRSAAASASKPNAADKGKLREFRIAGPYQSYLQQQGLLVTFLEERRSRAGQPVWHTEATRLPPEHFHDSYIGCQACKFVEQVPDDAPWHLFVSFVGPHNPWDAPAAYVDRYADNVYSSDSEGQAEGKPSWIAERVQRQSGNMTEHALQKVKQHYAGAIQLIDDCVGELLERIDQRGFTDNTIVVFCADHGEMLGDHGMFLKTVFYEGALRVPLIIADPRSSRQGEVSDALVELTDLHPTFLDWAELDYSRNALDGKSLLPLLNGKTDEHKSYQISELLNGRMIGDKKYKYIENYNDLQELYDLEADPGERRNLASELPGVASKWLKKLKQACK